MGYDARLNRFGDGGVRGVSRTRSFPGLHEQRVCDFFEIRIGCVVSVKLNAARGALWIQQARNGRIRRNCCRCQRVKG